MRGPGSGELYLEAIEQLKTTVKFFNSNKNFKSSDGVVYHANQLLAKSISKLEEELKTLLYNYSEFDRLFEGLPKSEKHQSEGGGGKHSSEQQKSLETAIYTLPTLIPLRVVLVLHDLALQMVQVGRQLQLLRIFRDTRTTVLEQSLRKLGVERLTKVDAQRLQWEVLEAKIVLEMFWPKARDRLKNYFFYWTCARESCYEFEIVFGSKAYMEMKESVFNLAIQLAQTAQETFIDFEEALERDATKSVVLDGSVHPLTSYVINYVKFLFDYQSTVKELFQELELDDPQGQLADVTTRIMQALQNNLDGKSKIYRDPALTQLFLMNNIHYIVRSVVSGKGYIRR